MRIYVETSQIHNAIAGKLANAQQEILICVAWFTSKALSNVLIDRARKVKIEIIISDHEFNNRARHLNSLLTFENCSVYITPTLDEKLMHNKFCVIDQEWIITGSYNWSDKAESNFENIIVCSDNGLAKQYSSYFQLIKQQSNKITDFNKYVKGFINNARLEAFETDTNNLSKQFEEEVLKNLRLSKKYIRINFQNIEDTIRQHSAVGTARILCNNPEIQSGLAQLRDNKQLKLSLEWLVLQPQYSPLFSDTTKMIARQKLEKCKFEF